MNFAIACLAALAIFATASADEQSFLRAGVNPVFQAERITNGLDAVPNEFPYQISLQWRLIPFFGRYSHICGGSIINELWVVTAGHCFTETPIFGSFQVVAGAHNVNSNEATQQARGIAKHIVNPGYKGGVNPHDIALIKLASPLTINDVVAPIALPTPNSMHGGNAILSGWGSTSLTSAVTLPVTLQKTYIPILDTEICYDALSAIVRNPPLDPTKIDNVCAGPLDSSRISACSGDSGGPLAQVFREIGPVLIGVVSWGINPCGAIAAPSVFVRVSPYVDWINAQIAKN